MYAAIDLHKNVIQAVIKDKEGNIIKENRMKRDIDTILNFFKDIDATIVMESGYNYQYLYDIFKDKGYDVKVAHPLMVKAIAYAKVKSDKVDARILADLLRMDMIPECYIPDNSIRDIRDIVRRRYYLVCLRTMLKNKIYAELDKRWIDYSNIFTIKGKMYLRSLRINAIDDYLDIIDFR